MSEIDPAWIAATEAGSDDPETYLSWTDDAVTLICERAECQMPGPCPDGLCWYQVDLPYKLTPEMATAARDAHLRTHGGAA